MRYFNLRDSYDPGGDLFCAIVRCSIHFSLLLKQGERSSKYLPSQVRQLTVACLSYCQDHQGRFPGAEWVKEITPYVRKRSDAFVCPSDSNSDVTVVSYGYNGLLVLPDSSGIMQKDVNKPAEVGLLCNAGTYTLPNLPNGGLIGGGALRPTGSITILPAPRHSNGTIVGYADGHVCYVPNGYAPNDISNGVTRAFYLASALRFVNNPAGGICGFGAHATAADPINIGGEPCTAAILRTAAWVWAQQSQARITDSGFLGQGAVTGRTDDYLWGTGDGIKPAGHAVAIARDALVLIVAKNTTIPREWLCGNAHDGYAISKPSLQHAFSEGCSNGLQAYTFGGISGTRRFFCARLGQSGKPLQLGSKAIVVADDFAMVDRVARDPSGIGYCSSALVDPERVQLLGLQTADGVVHYYPQDNLKYRWLVQEKATWPLMRTLYAQYGGKARNRAGTGIVNVMLAPGGAGTKALQDGPLFQASYYLP